MNRLSASFVVAISILLLGQRCQAFAPAPRSVATPTVSKTSLSLMQASDLLSDPENSRRLFYFWFGGTSGGGGIALAAFPKMYDRFSKVQDLKGVGPTLGGEKLGISTLLCGLPEDLSKADVEKILKNKMTTERMVDRGPQENYFASKGYLTFDAFEKANQKTNPLALRAIFDALTTSSSIADPEDAQSLLDSFRDDTENFKSSLLKSKFRGYSAIGFLLFLLSLAVGTCADAFSHGWFPEWPGTLPIGLISPGFWTIPDYWI